MIIFFFLPSSILWRRRLVERKLSCRLFYFILFFWGELRCRLVVIDRYRLVVINGILILSLSHSLFSASLSLRLLISSSNFCTPTLQFLSTIFITQILVSLIFIFISLTEFFLFISISLIVFFFFFHSLLSILISEPKLWRFGFRSLYGLSHLKAKRVKVSFWILYFGVTDSLGFSNSVFFCILVSSLSSLKIPQYFDVHFYSLDLLGLYVLCYNHGFKNRIEPISSTGLTGSRTSIRSGYH